MINILKDIIRKKFNLSGRKKKNEDIRLIKQNKLNLIKEKEQKIDDQDFYFT